MEEKICSKCKKELPATLEFFHKSIKGKYGLRAKCKECRNIGKKIYREKNKEKINETQRQYRENNREKILKGKKDYYYKNHEKCKEERRIYDKNVKRFKTYNITKDIFIDLLILQKNKCKICNNIFINNSKAFIDHNHKNGTIRGLLCMSCNLGLGNFKDNPTLLNKAAEYIKKNQ